MTHDLIRRLADICPPGSPPPDAATRARLAATTRDLIDAARRDGRVLNDPRELALTRKVEVNDAAARAVFSGRRVLVTGAAGCVAGALIPRLAGYGAGEILGLDLKSFSHPQARSVRADVRDEAALDGVFGAFRPQIVIHLAAEREPGKAEKAVYDAVTTNIIGTANVIAACRTHGTERAVYSSTGKCFAYLTDHVYTATKKVAEHLWADAARTSATTRFAAARFTHLLENGIVFREIEQGVAAGLIEIHGPDRNFNLQNLNQATGLLLHAATAAEAGKAHCFVAQDIGWPVNVLDFTLWRIVQSGHDLPLRFLGVPPGYDEVFFRGQFDWSGESDIHPLVNALEHPGLTGDATGTIGAFDHRPADRAVVQRALGDLRGAADALAADPAALKQRLLETVGTLTASVFSGTSAARLEDVLRWGTDPDAVTPELLARFRPVTDLLRAALEKARASV